MVPEYPGLMLMFYEIIVFIREHQDLTVNAGPAARQVMDFFLTEKVT